MTGKSFDARSAIAEARGFCRMFGVGRTIEELRGLIALPAKTKRALRSERNEKLLGRSIIINDQNCWRLLAGRYSSSRTSFRLR